LTSKTAPFDKYHHRYERWFSTHDTEFCSEQPEKMETEPYIGKILHAEIRAQDT
jgi:hypothetical protein